jgi:hypothetical protein
MHQQRLVFDIVDNLRDILNDSVKLLLYLLSLDVHTAHTVSTLLTHCIFNIREHIIHSLKAELIHA